MRTTRDENRAIGEWMGGRFNQMEGPVRLLLPEKGVSVLDAPGKPFCDPEADNALFESLERTVRQTGAATHRAGRRQYQRRRNSSRRWSPLSVDRPRRERRA